MTQKLPAMPFYIGDWKKDACVQSLDYWTRGIWFEILLIMWDSQDRGRLLLNNKPYPTDALARALSLTEKETEKALKTLLDYGVAKRGDDGVIYNKRMVEDQEKRLVKAVNGAKGGRGNKANQKLNKSKNKAKTKLITETEYESETDTKVLSKSMKLSEFEIRWKRYKGESDGKKLAIGYWNASVKTLDDLADYDKAEQNYYSVVEDSFEGRRLKSGKTWFNNWRDYIDQVTEKREVLDPRDDPLDEHGNPNPIYEPNRNGGSNGQPSVI